MSDADIEAAIAAVKAGDVDAYETVVRTFQRRLRAWIAVSCPPGVEADEIAHVAFIKAFKQIDLYEAGTNFFAWLCAFARNTLMGEYKTITRQAKNQENYLQHLVVTWLEEIEAHGEVFSDETVQALRHCLGLLPEKSRRLMSLRYQDDRPLESIARLIGKNVSAIKFQLFAVRRKLRECIGRELARGEA